MEKWVRGCAIALAGVMVAGPVFAQGGGAGGTQPQTGAQQSTPGGSSPKSDSMKSDAMKPDDKAGKTKADKAGAKSDQVRAAQQALKDKGHDPGAIDGVMGPKTQAALRDFQKAEGIQTTGRLDAETMSKLGVASASGRTRRTDTGEAAASPKTGDTSGSTGASGSPATSSDMSKDATKDKSAPRYKK